MTFFELMSVAYLDFLEYAITKDEDFEFTLQGDTDSSCATLQDIVCNCKNSEVVWLGNDWSLNIIKRNENQPGTTQDFLTKPLSVEKFFKIRDRMLGEHSHIDMLNAMGTKNQEDRSTLSGSILFVSRHMFYIPPEHQPRHRK